MIRTIYLGAGCFWGAEEFFRRKDSIIETEVGYSNGKTKRNKPPTYEEVCSYENTFCEVVKISFDDNVISFKKILDMYFCIINPYIRNKQGNDIGVQYRTLITSEDDQLLEEAKEFISNKQKDSIRRIRVIVETLINYFKAEEYHQKYLIKNPNGYCHIKLN